jgi:ubiquitin-protein ligase
MAMNTSVKRLRKEAQQQESVQDDYIKLQPHPAQDNIFVWKCLIRAPPDSVYEGYVFLLDIDIPEQYPLVPPVIRFNAQTPIFHPNVLFTSGEICLDILKKVYPSWV